MAIIDMSNCPMHIVVCMYHSCLLPGNESHRMYHSCLLPGNESHCMYLSCLLPGNESHAGQVFTCIGALSLAGALHLVDQDLFCWWLSERQTKSGGLNGRPEKLQDVGFRRVVFHGKCSVRTLYM